MIVRMKTKPFDFAEQVFAEVRQGFARACEKRGSIKPLLLILAVCMSVSGLSEDTNDNRPALREPPARLVKVIDSLNSENYAAVCVNVTRDVVAKKIRLYASTSKVKPGLRKIGDFEIDVIYHQALVAEEKTSGGGYHLTYNGVVFTFAIAQFASGNKELGLSLVKLIGEVQPEFWWSSPTHPPMTIKEIIAGLEKEDASVKELLKEEENQWSYIVKEYGP